MKNLILAVLVASFIIVEAASAALINSDFLVFGDNLLITDTSTNQQWLSPFYTRNHSYNDSFVQSVIAGNGFQYAVASDVLNMINNNFNNPFVGSPGNAAGFVSAQNFFTIFGINEHVICDGLACPRTQGLTATPGGAGTHLAFGMIQFGSDGWLIANNSWADSFSDIQMGSWLVRDAAPVPVPAAALLFGSGLIGLVGWQRKCLSKTV
jgi:hypothetical protein